MSEDKNGNKSTNMLNNLIKDGVKKFSDGLQNIANNMDHPFTGKFPDAPSTSSNNSVPTGLITFDLGITIQEVTTGCIKKLKISRKVFSADGSFYTEDSILEVPIKKGLRAGSRITFPNAGDRYPQKKADDLVVIIYDKPNQQYIRDKDDVTYRCNLSISDALCGCILHIPLILGGTYQMTITDVIQPGTTRRIRGEGIPNNRTGGIC
uniref:Chaperone DnaJ C-terminal domain-containing protein n=1 Tax=Parascaris univalens TaxID=6257 RepID=A0A915BWZ7_PARUN